MWWEPCVIERSSFTTSSRIAGGLMGQGNRRPPRREARRWASVLTAWLGPDVANIVAFAGRK